MPVCDWYQATIAKSPQEVGEALLVDLPGAHGFEAGRGRLNYHHSMRVLDVEGETLATILHGGPNGDPNVCASGGHAPAFASVIRKLWPLSPRVTRYDSAEDLHGDYSSIRDRCRALAEPSGVSGYEIAAHGEVKGSTDYLGAKSSRVQHRCYEKGKQMAPLVADSSAISPDWIRLEVQWRPDKAARMLAAVVSPEQVWGVSPWVQAIAREVVGVNPARLLAQPKPLTTFQLTHRAFKRQYGPHMLQLISDAGSPALFGEKLALELSRGGPSLG